VFDLDTAVIDRRGAWRYAVEEAVLTVTGERVDASPLLEEYCERPWIHALPILLPDQSMHGRCAEVCEQYFRRSALKRLLVFDGIGMALDRLRGDYVEMGGITRESHANAMRQVESTGIDRFLSVLAPTNGGPWDPAARFGECASYLEVSPDQVVYVSGRADDALTVAQNGGHSLLVGWGQKDGEAPGLAHPSALRDAVEAAAGSAGR
jgi:phosphoglycolate phosphatase-like HAD superfamily hydrolase